MDIIPFFLVQIMCSYSFITAAAFSNFHFLCHLIQFFCFDHIIVEYRTNRLLISSLLILVVCLVFSEPFCSCKQKFTTIPRICNILPKQKKCYVSLNFKIALKRVLLYIIKGCKITPSLSFLQNCFFRSTLSVKHLKSLW